MTEQNTQMVDETEENSTFADEVEQAIDNMQIAPVSGVDVPKSDPETAPEKDVPAGTDLVRDDDTAADDKADNKTGMPERGEHGFTATEPYAPELLATGGNEKDVPKPFADMPKTEQLAPGQVIITDEPDAGYDSLMKGIKGRPGFAMFLAGFSVCLQELQNFIDERKDDEDAIAIIFNDWQEKTPDSAFLAATTEWANHQDVSDGALLPKAGSPADTEKRQLDLAQRSEGFEGQTPKEAATRQDFSAYDRPQLEAMLGEQLAIVESLQQSIQRDNQTPELWAAITEYFNTVMTGEPEDEADAPLVMRIQLFVNRLRNQAWVAANYDHKNEPDFYELPPILSDLLLGMPESHLKDAEPGEQLALLVKRLQADSTALIGLYGFFGVPANADNRNDLLAAKIDEMAEDAKKYNDMEWQS